MIDRAELPVYLRISDKAKHLRELGMSDREIVRALRVSDKTVAKAGRQHEQTNPTPSVSACPANRPSAVLRGNIEAR